MITVQSWIKLMVTILSCFCLCAGAQREVIKVVQVFILGSLLADDI
jgi:hypothetical protein